MTHHVSQIFNLTSSTGVASAPPAFDPTKALNKSAAPPAFDLLGHRSNATAEQRERPSREREELH